MNTGSLPATAIQFKQIKQRYTMSKLIVTKDSAIYKNFIAAQEAQAILDGIDATVKANKKIVDAYKDLIKEEIAIAKLDMKDSPVSIVVEMRGKEKVLVIDKLSIQNNWDSKKFAEEYPKLVKQFTSTSFKHGITITTDASNDTVTVVAG